MHWGGCKLPILMSPESQWILVGDEKRQSMDLADVSPPSDHRLQTQCPSLPGTQKADFPSGMVKTLEAGLAAKRASHIQNTLRCFGDMKQNASTRRSCMVCC